MKKLLPLLGMLALPVLAPAQSFVGNLTPGQEAADPGTRSGSGIINLVLVGQTMTLSGSFMGLSGTFSDIHIHGAATPGVNAGVLYSLNTPSLLTLGADNKSGTINGQITLSPTPNGRNVTIAQQIQDLNSGLWYFNVHSTPLFGGGEIRGQILAVPEPSTLALVGLGIGGLLVRQWRRRVR